MVPASNRTYIYRYSACALFGFKRFAKAKLMRYPFPAQRVQVVYNRNHTQAKLNVLRKKDIQFFVPASCLPAFKPLCSAPKARTIDGHAVCLPSSGSSVQAFKRSILQSFNPFHQSPSLQCSLFSLATCLL